jgi:polysaccharide biosynthesis transport protein
MMKTDQTREISRSIPRTERAGMAPQADVGADMLATFWRYRWAVILPAIAGALIGFLVFTQTPETYRSTTRLMVQADRPAALDMVTGDVFGGVQSIDIVRSQLYSDDVIAMAYQSPAMQPFHPLFANDPKNFIGAVNDSLKLEPEVEDARTAQSLVTLLHYESTNQELCKAAVESFSKALQQFFNQQQKDSRSELINLITTAKDQLYPKMLELEQSYRDFRRDAPLAWDSTGEAINPHRERQLFLVQRRSELIEMQRRTSTELAAIESAAQKSAKDPLLALDIIGQLLGKTFTIPTAQAMNAAGTDATKDDMEMAQLQLEEKLLPLEIKRDQFAKQLGDKHPTVQELDAELGTMRSQMSKLIKQRSDRILQLMSEDSSLQVENPRDRALQAVQAVIFVQKAEVELLAKQITEVDQQIATEKAGAAQLALAEEENRSQVREIERTRELLDKLEGQMARVSLTEEEEGTRVIELTAPTNASKVGPNLTKSLGLGAFLGLALGAGLALLLEKNANTFRDPDEISAMLGVPVLTHVPFFKGRVKRAKKGEINPFKDLDPYLAVVHTPASIPAEAIRSCRTSIFFETSNIEGGKIIQVTSPLPGDGKSTIAGNLACSIAQSGKRVLAIDCDLRRPQLTDNFALADANGITNVLNGDCEPHEACHSTPIATLSLMPSGPIPANPAEALTLPEMADLLQMLREEYDYIIIDTPPLLVVTDPSIIASMVDGVLLTLRIRRKSKPNAQESINILRAVGANVMGLVINNSDEASSSDGYRGYGYYRYGRYTSRYYRRNGEGKGTQTNMTDKSPVLVSGRGVAKLKKQDEAIQPMRTSRQPTSELVDDDILVADDE